jgi:hypothetical protein
MNAKEMYSTSIETLQSYNPLDLLEEIVSANHWIFERSEDDEMVVDIFEFDCPYRLYFLWQAERNAMQFACQFNCVVTEKSQRTINDLLSLINQRLWLGHFDVSEVEHTLLFRHTMLVNGFLGATTEQLKDLVQIAMIECQRCYPAFQLVLVNDRSAEEAFILTLDTVGEA